MTRQTCKKALTSLIILGMMIPSIVQAASVQTTSRPSVIVGTVPVSTAQQLPPPPVEEPKPDHRDAFEMWKDLPLNIRAKVDPRLLAELQGQVVPTHLSSDPNQSLVAPRGGQPIDRTRFLVHLKAVADLKAISNKRFTTPVEQRIAVFNALANTAQVTQGSVKAVLNTRMIKGNVASYQPLYIFNGFVVEGGVDTIIELAQRDDVERIVANYPLVPLWDGRDQVITPISGLGSLDPDNWNIDHVDAEQVWDELGITGAGAVVANIDTGVDWMHPALQTKYRGYNAGGSGVHIHDYNWFDPDPVLYPGGDLGPSRTAQPFDYGQHGTHTMGTMVGDGETLGTQVGMAPGAQWVAISLDELYVSGSIADDIMGYKAFQWMLCPTDLTGALATADCSKAPDVVNNSWGSANPADDTFRPAIQALRAAGVAPVFAAGNPSAGPGSIGAPANIPEAIAVGATDRDDNVASFSGRGPSFYEGEQKPELSAPGVRVRSTVPGGSYADYSGTSMAAPHVAGLIALMVSADLEDGFRDLNVDELEHFMEHTAADLGPLGPDDDYGYGRIDAYDAVRWARSAGDLQGAVRDVTTNAPVAGATITGARTNSDDTFIARTAAGGQYSTTVPAGTYNVTVQAWGHYSSTFFGQKVIAGVFSIADFSLVPMPAATLIGRVRRGTTPISGALVYVADQPSVNLFTGADGTYALTLPIGTHELVVEAAGHRILREDVDVASGGSSHNLLMTSAPTILLVDADTFYGWFIGWPVRNYFKWALDEEDYLYDTWIIQDNDFNDVQWVDGHLVHGVPSATTLHTYDAVIWAHSGSDFGWWGGGTGGSPGDIGADDELMNYLDNGGRLILSGQDIGYYDDGRTFYNDYLHAEYMMNDAANEGDTVSGQKFLTGLNPEITNASLHGYANGATYLSLDAVMPRDGAAFPVLTYSNGNSAAALAIDPCNASYRAVYFALGYENIAPRAANRDPAIADVLDRSIVWLMGSKPAYDFDVVAVPPGQASGPGDKATYNLQVINTGSQPVSLELSSSGNAWPTRIQHGTTVLTSPVGISPCGLQNLTLEVDIPPTADTGDEDVVTITASRFPAGTPSVSTQVTTIAFPQWQTETPMPTARYRLAVASVPGDIHYYAIGGQDWNRGVSTNERYNACTNDWESMAPMPTSRGNIGAAIIDGKVHVPAGWSDGEYYDVLEIYDVATDSWSTGAPVPEALSGAAVAAHDGKLYVFGGFTSSGYDANTTYEYDPAADTWSEKAPMPGGGRSFAVAAGLNGKIYVVGGWYEANTVEVYDPTLDSWSVAAPMNVGRQSPGLTTAPDGYLYVAGGGSGWTGLDSAERYDPSTDTWRLIPSLNDAERAGSALAYAAGRTFAVGGSDWGLSDVNESLQLFDTFCTSRKSAWQSVIQPGDRITYTVEIHPDSADLTNVSLVDPIPTGTTFAGFGVNPIGVIYDSIGDRVTWNGPVPVNASPMTFTFGVDVAASGWTVGDPIINIITFDSGAGLVVTSTAVNLLDLPDPSRSIKRVDKSTALAVDTLIYTISVATGSTISDVFTMRDPIPNNTVYVPNSLTFTRGAANYDPGTDAIVWTGILPDADGYVNVSDSYEWGDSDGNGLVSAVTFDWVDATGGSVAIGSHMDDDYAGPFDIGFTFDHYGVDYTQFYINSNGSIQFEGGYAWYEWCPIDIEWPNNAIHLLGRDTIVDGANSRVYYQTFGSSPNRYTVVEFHQLRNYGGSDYSNLEIILYENGNIKFQYQDMADSMTSGTIGIENNMGDNVVQYSDTCPATVHDNMAILFLPPGGSTSDAGADITFAVTTAASLPVNTWITNTTTIVGPYNTIQRSAGTLVNSVDLGSSWQRVDKERVAVEETVTYDFLLQNTGLLAATGATLVDAITTHTTYVPGTLACGSGSCDYDSETVTWVGDIAPGGSVTLTFDVVLNTVLPDRTLVTNTAYLNNGSGDMYDLETVFLASSSNLGTSFHQADPALVNPGDAVTFTIYVYNSGNVLATGEMQDDLPSLLDYESGSLACSSGSCGYVSGTITWTGTLVPRGMVPVRFRAVVQDEANHGEWITNTAIVADPYGTVACSASVLVNPVDLTDSWKRVNQAQAIKGETLTYDFFLQNTGVSTATGAVLTDVIPSSLVYVPGSLNCGGGSCNYATGVITWTGDIAPDDSLTLTFSTILTSSLHDQTVVTNTAHLNDGYGPVLALQTPFLARSADLSASYKQADKMDVLAGEVVVYDFVLQSTGFLTAAGATLTDTIPPNVVYVPGSLSCGVPGTLVYPLGSCGYASGVVTWTGDIAPDDSVFLTFAVTLPVALPDRTPVTNTAYLDDGHEHLYNLKAAFLARSSYLGDSFKQAAPDQVEIDGIVTYTIHIYNSGIVSTMVEMRDELPSGLTYVPDSLVCGVPGSLVYDSCEYADGVIIWTGPVAAQSLVPVHFRATVSAGDSPYIPVVNTAVVTDTFWNVGYSVTASVDVLWHKVHLPLLMRNSAP
ncbi:MAG: DUF11 domain-containing protein [Chloroflexi bacterium]|nr:DUF11 domain-containing protein [Chloroflexota bacterium]